MSRAARLLALGFGLCLAASATVAAGAEGPAGRPLGAFRVFTQVAARVGGLRVVVTRPWLRHATCMADSCEQYKYGILDPMRVDRMRARTR